MAGRNDAQNVFKDSLVDFICQNFSQIYPVCSKSVHRLFLLEVNYSNTFLSTFHSRAATTGVMTPFCTTWPPAWLTWRVFAGTATLPGFEPTTVARCLISWCRQIWDLTFAFWTREKTGLDFYHFNCSYNHKMWHLNVIPKLDENFNQDTYLS